MTKDNHHKSETVETFAFMLHTHARLAMSL